MTNIAIENGPLIDDFPNKTSIYNGFSIAMLNYQRVAAKKVLIGAACCPVAASRGSRLVSSAADVSPMKTPTYPDGAMKSADLKPPRAFHWCFFKKCVSWWHVFFSWNDNLMNTAVADSWKLNFDVDKIRHTIFNTQSSRGNTDCLSHGNLLKVCP